MAETDGAVVPGRRESAAYIVVQSRTGGVAHYTSILRKYFRANGRSGPLHVDLKKIF